MHIKEYVAERCHKTECFVKARYWKLGGHPLGNDSSGKNRFKMKNKHWSSLFFRIRFLYYRRKPVVKKFPCRIRLKKASGDQSVSAQDLKQL